MSEEPATLASLDQLLAAIRAYDDPRRAAAEWKQAMRLLQKTSLPALTVTNVVAGRDVVRLAALIGQLRAPPRPRPRMRPTMTRSEMRSTRSRSGWP